MQRDDFKQERLFAIACAAPILAFAAIVLGDPDVGLSSFLGLASQYVAIALIVMLAALLCFAAVSFVSAGRASGWQASPSAAIMARLRERWRGDRFFSLLWPVGLFLLLMPVFNTFKQRILPDAGFLHDARLAEIDRLMFGTDPGIWLHQMVGSPMMTRFLDAVYHSWFVPTTLGLCVVGLCAGMRMRAQYMFAYIGTWILLGAVAAYALPAAGPAFYADLVGTAGAAPFDAVHASLAATQSGGAFLTSLFNQHYLLQNLDSPALVMGGGISAIPSVHNAMAVLFAAASFRAHWLAGAAMSGFALLIWIASVYLNWHYAIDGIIGAVGALALWFGSGWLVDRMMARRDASASIPLSAELRPAQ